MIRRAVSNLLRRQVQLEDDQTSVNLQFVVGRRTIRLAIQSIRNDAPRRSGGGFFHQQQAQPRRGFGPDTLFDDEFLDIDDEGFVELPDGTRIHVQDPRLPVVLGRFAP
jgi:hypothetical protein